MNTGHNKVALASATISPGQQFVCASFDFSPSVREELSLVAGDVIKVLNEVDDFWLRGLKLHSGESGQFPKDFVTRIDIPRCSENETLLYALDTFYPEASEDLPFEKGDIIVLERKINNEWGTGRTASSLRGMFPLNYTERLLPLTISSFEQTNPGLAGVVKKDKPSDGSKGLGLAKAIMDLTAQLDEELSFCTGDEITITEVLEDGSWYRGSLGSNTGTFPASFVQLLGPLKTKETKTPHPSAKVSLNRTGSKAWKEGVISPHTNSTNNNNHVPSKVGYENSKVVEKYMQNTSEYRYAEDVLPSGAKKEISNSTGMQANKKSIYTVTSLHHFTGKTDQELSFDKDTRISITEEVDEHWLMGTMGQREGYVPRSYVTIENTRSVGSTEENPQKERKDEKRNENFNTNGVLATDRTGVRQETQNTNYVKLTGSKLSDRHHVYSSPFAKNRTSIKREINMEQNKKMNLKKALALYDYEATNQFDLSIYTGDALWVFREVDENWCEVKNESGQEGIVPTSYIQYAVEGETSTPVLPSAPAAINLNVNMKSVPDKGMAEPNQFHTQSYSAKYHVANAGSKSSAMPVLFESTDKEGSAAGGPPRRGPAFDGPKPYGSQRQHPPQNRNVPLFKKSMSVDSSGRDDRGNYPVNRSNSNPYPQYGSRGYDPHSHLKAWQKARQRSHQPSDPSSERVNAIPNVSENVYETPICGASPFSRSAGRSVSMREKRSPLQMEEEVVHNSNFVKIKSDSDLTVEAVKGRQRPRSAVGKRRHTQVPASVASVPIPFQQTRCSTIAPRVWNSDSVSTTSTESASSYGDSRASHSTHSDTSGQDAGPPATVTGTSGSRIVRRSAPPIPPHQNTEKGSSDGGAHEQCQDVNYPPSPWSPPVPKREQSLYREVKMPQSEQPSPTIKSPVKNVQSPKLRNTPPARPAPKLPPGHGPKPILSPKMAKNPSNPPQKKVAPMRPANPPMAPQGGSARSQGQQIFRPVTSKETKQKMEKLRSDIEEYSRMKKDLENLYKGTLDGKERREISENKEFVKANLKRLQKEFHDIINDQQDHIYESIGFSSKQEPPQFGDDVFHSSLTAPPPLPQTESPGSVRRKKREKRLLVIKEIVKTERDFLTDVTVTIEDIMKELLDRQISQTTISTLFGNIEQVRNFSEVILEGFERALASESLPEQQRNPEDSTIGQVFIDNIPGMKAVYMTYCRNHDDSIALLEKCEADVEFTRTVAQCLETVKSKVNAFDLASFLIKPFQRVFKYPLFIGELIKVTDGSGASDMNKLMQASKMMQSVANDINEDKRTKDLVRKYKNMSNEGLTEKLGKISIKSLKKKSTRISRRLVNVAGLTTQGTRDIQFDEIERRFKTLERALKMFVVDVTSYCDRCRDALCAELNVAKAMVDVVVMPDRTHPVSQYQAVVEKMSGPLYRQFHDQVQLRALSPISSLSESFKSPQAIIDKRSDKLIDYERLEKNSDSKEKIQAAKHDYEALNKPLLDELPKLCDLGLKLLSSCAAMFVQVHRDFQQKLVDALKPLLMTIQQTDNEEPKIPSNLEIQDRFHPAHSEAAHVISRLQVVPASFGALFGMSRGSAELTRKTKPQLGGRTSHEGSQKPSKQSATTQPMQDRQALLQKYRQDQLYVAVQAYNASQLMDVSCYEGDLLAVLKQQDPMGSKERWFVDRGVTNSTGFLPCKVIRPYDPATDERTVTKQGGQALSSSPTVSVKPRIPAPRQKSPTPSSRSTSSSESGTPSGGTKARLSPFSVREKLATLNKSGSILDSGQQALPNLLDSDILEVFAEEDEIFDDNEYEVLPSTSPKINKQHFRAEYDFAARSNLELSIHCGEIVKLIMAHDTDGNSEWWLVSNSDGKQGYVPFNYLTRAEYL